MKDESIEIKYRISTIDELNVDDRLLVLAAKKATYSSYSPYSHFRVGVAVLLTNGEVIKGSNQENAAFGAGTCAERCAMFYANAAYPEEFITCIAIAARGTDGTFIENPISPCGICRQALLEAEIRAGKHIKVLMSGAHEVIIIDSLSQLLPFQFDAIV